MTMQYALMSHGQVLGYTGTAFPSDELPSGASLWQLVPTAAFDFVEPIIAELTAPPALSLVEEVIPTQDAYLHPARGEHEAQMERAVREAARIHHFRLVLERYEGGRDPRGALGRRAGAVLSAHGTPGGHRGGASAAGGIGRLTGAAAGGG